MKILAVASLLLAGMIGCAQRVRPDESVLRVRELVGVEVEEGERPRAIVAELDRVDGLPPRLTFTSLLPSGAGRTIAVVDGAEADEIAERFVSGASLREAACHALAPCTEIPPLVNGDAAALEGRLEGWRLSLRRGDHPRWGEAWVVTLEADGRTIGILRAMAREARLVLLGDGAAALATGTRAGGFHTGDVIPIDTWVQASRLLVAAAEDALDEERPDDARDLLERAAALDETAARLHFARARLLARIGAGAAAVVAALRPAIEADPTRWRMEARTSDDFSVVREDEAFVALTRPRALPGSNRAGEPPQRDAPKVEPRQDDEAPAGDETPPAEGTVPPSEGPAGGPEPREEPEPIVVPPPP